MACSFCIRGIALALLISFIQAANPSGCRDRLDIVTVVDGSDSISAESFLMLKQALVELTQRLTIDKDYTRFGLVLYSSDIADKINFTGNRTGLEGRILGLQHPRDGTNTHLGISAMMAMISGTDREVDTIGIVITDGISKDTNKTIAQANLAKVNGVDMFSVGVGSKIDTYELQSIASSRIQCIKLPSFSELAETLKKMLPDVCPPTTTTTTTTPVPTTTTPEPTTATPKPTTASLSVDLCAGCKMSNGIGYNNHPSDCHKYVQCFFSADGSVSAFTMSCSAGLFWDQDGLSCNFAQYVNCTNDPCVNPNTLFYKTDTNCRQYHSCANKLAKATCCPPISSFNTVSNRCEVDETCEDLCQGEEVADEEVCYKRAVAGKPDGYQEVHPGLGWIDRLCAPGTGYSEDGCDCSVLIDAGQVPVANKECNPLLNLTFINGVTDTSGHWNWVENVGVVIENGEAYFDGTSGLRIPRFSNVALGSTFMIKMRYRTEGTVLGQQALVTNRDCGKPGSLDILLDQTITTFGMRTDGGQRTRISITAAPQSQWKELVYRVENGVLSGTINGNTINEDTNGAIGKSECALQIGRGNTYSNFKGYIDYIEVYQC
ncbi:protein PIF [Patella vulgata]|uniref:protein PIF n=1 Tax=Patella vulgata TaxID=6465 RepID=UPI0024A8B843|nr:protein PIF [Patella vulgata]